MNDMNHEESPVPDKLREWLSRAAEAGASDLHLIAGYPPVLRLHGDLIELSKSPLEGEAAQSLLCSLCPPEAFARLQSQKNIDFSFNLATNGRTSMPSIFD